MKHRKPTLPPPKHLPADAATIWREVVTYHANNGSLQGVDAGTIELYATSLIRLRRLNEALEAAPLLDAEGKPHPLLRTIEATANTVRNAAHVLMLNPGARKAPAPAGQRKKEGGPWRGVLD